MQTEEILLRPIITEKASGLSERLNKVSFQVHADANKNHIRDAVAQAYGVTPVKIRTLVNPGKLKRRGQSVGKRPNWKKAIVTLKEGDSIDFFATE